MEKCVLLEIVFSIILNRELEKLSIPSSGSLALNRSLNSLDNCRGLCVDNRATLQLLHNS